MVASAPALKGNASSLQVSKTATKPKAKQNRSSKKPKPTVIHADASSFRKLVQQLTRSESEEQRERPPVSTPEPAESSAVSPAEPETPTKSRIQSLAPPPLCPKLIKSGIVETKPLDSFPILDSMRPPNAPLSFSNLASFSWVKSFPYSPMALFSPLGELLSPFTSRLSTGSEFKWPNTGSQAQPVEVESPGAIAFREALNNMLPTGDSQIEEANGLPAEGVLLSRGDMVTGEAGVMGDAMPEATMVQV